MKTKTLAITLGVTVAAYTGAIFGSSFYFEKKYNEQLDRLSLNLQLQGMTDESNAWRIAERNYDRGLFDSTAYFVLEKNFSGGNPVKFVVNHQIRTGPWLGSSGIGLAKVDTAVHLDAKDLLPASAKEMSNKNLAKLKSVFTYWGSLSGQVNMPPFDIQFVKGERWTSVGASLDFGVTSFGKSLDLDFKMPEPGFSFSDSSGIKVSAGATSYKVTDARSDLDMFFLSGNQTFNLASLQVVIPEESFDLKLNKTQFSLNGETKNGFYSSDETILIEGTLANKPIRLEYGQKIANIHLENIEQLSKEVNTNYGSLSDKGRSIGVDVLKKYPVISIAPLTIVYGDEVLDADFKLSFNSISKNDENMPLEMLFISKAKIEFGATIPASFLDLGIFNAEQKQSLKAQIKDAQRKGMMVFDGKNYTTHFSYDGGSMMLNGMQQNMGF